jgi:hypothetical protein
VHPVVIVSVFACHYEAEVTLRLAVGRSVRPSWCDDQISVFFWTVIVLFSLPENRVCPMPDVMVGCIC